MVVMRTPIFVRELADDERKALEEGLRSSDAFVLRRCQIVLASARGKRAPGIASDLGCSDDTVRNVIHMFNETGLEVLVRGSTRPHNLHVAFYRYDVERLRALLHQSPRNFGKPTSLWTLDLAAEVSSEQGLTATRVTDETIRATLVRMGVRWRRAKHWISSPDPEYTRKKSPVTG
jgi:transposase